MNYVELCVFLVGICIGSFLNVVIYRYNTGISIATGRSRCGTCGKVLKWYELIPVLSFIVQRGMCRTCRSRLSWQYPLVELVTGLLFVAIFRIATGGEVIFLALMAALLVVLFVYDMRHKILPDLFVYLFAFIALLYTLFYTSTNPLTALIAGPVVALPFFFLWVISQGRWIGLGDSKIALGVGWLLGISGGFTALLLAVWIGALVGIVLLVIKHIKGDRSMSHEIPFGPFIIIGMLIVFWQHIDFISIVGMFDKLFY